MPITSVVFDFDGVLADTEKLHLGAFQQVFRKRGWDLSEGAYFDRYLGYDEAAAIAKQALKEGRTIREVVVERGHVKNGTVTEEQLDEALDVLRMTHP